MARFKLYLEYEGTRYSGWQVQKDAKTIQGELYKAAKDVFGDVKIEIYGAGRTDAGVHAIEQVAHLDVPTKLSIFQIHHQLNDALPHDISIINVEVASPTFHARHDAQARSYIYVIARRKTAFGKKLVWWIKDPLNAEIMQQSAESLLGLKDFKNFSDDTPDEKSTLVKLQACDVYEYGETLIIHVVGSHFLWKQVRRMVGILAEIGRGKMNKNAVDDVFSGKIKNVAQYTAPPSGLYLERVYYAGEEILTGENAFKLPFSVI